MKALSIKFDERSSCCLLSDVVAVMLDRREYSLVADLIDSAYLEEDRRLLPGLYTAAQALIDMDVCDKAYAITKYLRNVAGHDLAALGLHIQALIRLEKLAEAETAMSRLSDTDYILYSTLLVARLDFLIRKGDRIEIERLVELLGPLTRLDSRRGYMVIIAMANFGCLPELAIDLVHSWLSKDFSFRAHFRPIMEIVGKSNQEEKLLETIRRIDRWQEYPDLCDLYEYAKLAYLRKRPRNAPELPSPALSEAEYETTNSPRVAVFLCVDRAYALGGYVSLLSCLRNSATELSDFNFHLFVEDKEMSDLFKDIATTLAPIFPGLSLEVQVLDPPKLSPEREAYGIAGDVSRLSLFAYSRIYAAQQLQAAGYARAIYLDADLVVRTSLRELARMDLHDLPLAAHTDRPILPIQKAARIHRIPPSAYFNSGVMVFNFAHPSINTLLQRAIDFSEDPSVELIFHDQCALNRAARGRYMELGRSYNHMIEPGAKIVPRLSEAQILHYITTPKPWINIVHSPVREAWLEEWRKSATLIGPVAAASLAKMSAVDIPRSLE